MKVKIVLLVSLLVMNFVSGVRISIMKDRKNLSNSNEKLSVQVNKKEKITSQTATEEKSSLKPISSKNDLNSLKSEEELYELERANAMAEMIF